MNYKLFIFSVVFLFISSHIVYSQGKKIDSTDYEYKFKISIPVDWVKVKNEETKNHDGVSYVYNSKKDSTISCMIMAFKVPQVKEIDDFIYVLEKDATLNIPQRNSEFTPFDNGTNDGKLAIYKDLLSTELIYYFRTKNESPKPNFVYMLRFITTNYTNKLETLFKNVAGTFQILD